MFRFVAIVATLCLHSSEGIWQQQQEPDVATLLQVGNRAKGNRQQMHQFNDGDFQGNSSDSTEPLQLTIKTLGHYWAPSSTTDFEIQCWQGYGYPPENSGWLPLPGPDNGDTKFQKNGITTHTFRDVLAKDCTVWLSLRSKNTNRWGVEWISMPLDGTRHVWPRPQTCVQSDNDDKTCKSGFWLEKTCPNALPAQIPCYSRVSFNRWGHHKIKVEFVTLNINYAGSSGNAWLRFGNDLTRHGVEGFKTGKSIVVWLPVYYGLQFSNVVELEFDSTDAWGVNGIKVEDEMVSIIEPPPEPSWEPSWKPFYMEKGSHLSTYKGYTVYDKVKLIFTLPPNWPN